MFSRIELTGFRGFESYRLNDLRRVNLLVGKNNSGKTSVLEALHLLAANGNPRTFDEIAGSRTGRSNWARGRGDPVIDIAPFFFGHRISLHSKSFVETDAGNLFMEVVPLTDEEQVRYSDIGSERWEEEKFDFLEFGLSISTDGELKNAPSFPVNETGLMAWHSLVGRRKPISPRINSRLVSSKSIDARDMRPMWDNMLRINREDRIVHTIQALQPDIFELHFLSGPPPEVLLTLRDSKQRTPLHSFGDGTRRFLGLSLLLANLEDGLLLVDEIDTGLHWTVMEDLWRLVIRAARGGNVQVFATTHSYDCIKGLASLLEREPELSEEVSLQKLERRLDEAVAFRGEQIPIAIDHNIELR